MKTPREILLERHCQAETKLDAVRRKALAALPRPESDAAIRGESTGLLKSIWQQLIGPSRRTWAALAAVWVGLLVVNLEMKAERRPAPMVRSAPARELAGSVQAQQRLLVELLQSANPPRTDSARMAPRPRSERPALLKRC